MTATPATDHELDGKVCVVTGGGAGIGAATAATFAAHGARVAILDRDGEAAAAVERDLRAGGVQARGYEVDVTRETAVVEAAESVGRDFGGVDVLVNNAGIGRLGPSMTLSLEHWKESMEVMATGVFLCSREFGTALRARGGGVIVNVSSMNALAGFPMRLAYSAAKAAVVSMTQTLAVEWADYGIRVNAVAPGVTKTAMVQYAIDQGQLATEPYLAHTPLRRFGEPEEIAETILYLASERSSFITGQVLVPDGGWTAFGWIPWSGDPDAPGIAAS
jgi:NAD(P)-dependent dehydrogenase (short-subunit alcohol dehydrogenase family)